MKVECKIKEKIIKVNLELTQLCKESSRVNAQLVPRFEEKLLITTLGVHFWGYTKLDENFWGDNFWKRISEG